MSGEGEEFAIRMVKVDHYMASPIRGLDVVYSDFKSKTLTKVPVLRLFGVTREGEKACAHLHGVFPYICIPFEGMPSEKFMYDLAISLDRSLSSSATAGNSADVTQFVYKVEPVSGIPFYGFHMEPQHFIKIYFLNPWSIDKAVEILQSGSVMNRSFQPHEAHIPFVLQVFIDYNLYGMNFARFCKVAVRRDVDTSEALFASDGSAPLRLKKQSVCKVEVDVTIENILNKQDLTDSNLNPGISAIWEDAKLRRRCLMESSQMTPVSSQDRPRYISTQSEQNFLNEILEKLKEHDFSFRESSLLVPEVTKADATESFNLASGISSSPFYAVPTAGLSQISLNEDDLDLCNILNGLMEVDLLEAGRNDKNLNDFFDENDLVGDHEDELMMTQRFEFEDCNISHLTENIVESFGINDFVPQVDGPVGSPKKSEGVLQNSLTKLLRNFRLKNFDSSKKSESITSVDDDTTSSSFLAIASSPESGASPLGSSGADAIFKKTDITNIIERTAASVADSTVINENDPLESRFNAKIVLPAGNDTMVEENDAVGTPPETMSTDVSNVMFEENDAVGTPPETMSTDVSNVMFEENDAVGTPLETMSKDVSNVMFEENDAVGTPPETMSTDVSNVMFEENDAVGTPPETMSTDVRNVMFEENDAVGSPPETMSKDVSNVMFEESDSRNESTLPINITVVCNEDNLSRSLSDMDFTCESVESPPIILNMQSEPSGERTDDLHEIEICGMKVKVSPECLTKSQIKQLGHESLILRRLTQPICTIQVKPIEVLDEDDDDSVMMGDSKRRTRNSSKSEVVHMPIRRRRLSSCSYGSTYHSDWLFARNVIYNDLISGCESRILRTDTRRVDIPRSFPKYILDGKYLVVSVERLDEKIVNQYLPTTTNRRITTQKRTMQTTKHEEANHFQGSLYSESIKSDKYYDSDITCTSEVTYSDVPSVSNLKITPNVELQKRMQEIVDNQKREPVLLHIPELCMDIENEANTTPISGDENIMWGLSQLLDFSPLDICEPAKSSPPLCISPTDEINAQTIGNFSEELQQFTSTNTTLSKDVNSNISYSEMVTPVLGEVPHPCVYQQNSKTFTGDSDKSIFSDAPNLNENGIIVSNCKRRKVIPIKFQVDKDDDCLSSNSPIQPKSKRVKSQPKRPPRSRLKKKPLPTNCEAEAATKFLINELHAPISSNGDGIVDNVAANVKVIDPLSVEGLGDDDDDEGWIRLLGLPTENSKKSKGRGKNAKPKVIGPKRRRGRPRTLPVEFQPIPCLEQLSVPVSNEMLVPVEQNSSVCATVESSLFNFDNGEINCYANRPSVVVEPNSSAIYAGQPLTSYESEDFCSAYDWANAQKLLSSDLISNLCEPASSEFPEIFLNPLSDSVEEKKNSLDSEKTAKNNDLMSDIEKIVSEMRGNDYETENDVVNPMTLAICRRSSEESEPVAADINVGSLQLEENSGQSGLLMSYTSLATSQPEAGSGKHWVTAEIPECSDLMQVGENVINLTPTVCSFYEYENLTPWTSDGFVNSSFDNTGVIGNLVAQTDPETLAVSYVFTPNVDAPNPSSVVETLAFHNLPFIRHDGIYCSDPNDVPEKAVTLGGGAVVLKLSCSNDLPEAYSELSQTGLDHWRYVLHFADENGSSCDSNCVNAIKLSDEPSLYRGFVLEPSISSPSPDQVRIWLQDQSDEANANTQDIGAGEKVSQSSSLTMSPVLFIPSSQASSCSSPATAPFTKSLPNIYESTPVSSAKRNKLTDLKSDTRPKNIFAFQKRKLTLGELSTSQEIVHTDMPLLTNDLPLPKTSVSQLDGPTPKNKFGFKVSEESVMESTGVGHQYQRLTVMSMELYADCTGNSLPNPNTNEIRAIFYYIHKDCDSNESKAVTGCIYTAKAQDGLMVDDDVKLKYVATELELIYEFLQLFLDHDPEILVGYEIEMNSWGFLFERSSVLKIELWSAISRVSDDRGNVFRAPGANGEFMLKIVGRIVLAVGSLMKHELALYIYTFENVAYHVLHKRIPLFTSATLCEWFERPFDRWRTARHYLIRVKGNFQLLENLNVIGRTSELARLFGIQFEEVLNRGSQFRVESMMLRFCRRLQFVAVSPSVHQRAAMRAPEWISLVMEPVSKCFTDPVAVLDFQSLYPSIMIAYNYCFSTCLGRVANVGENESFKFGCTSLKVPVELLKKFKDDITVSPCGVMFVKQNVRKGVLPKMLEEILAARVMVKLEMKKRKKDQALYRILDARQLGLKLIANVTYGYTSANFSGRMPCVDIADSIVSKARETLERAIHLVENTSHWGARVVYGDTDSMFIEFKGKTKEQAFELAQEIAQAVTADNPKPVKLKLEKVYLPCILETKKRYVGFMYESLDASEPVYDAKGIETVRRDGCPAVAKILEKSLKILFRTKDISQVKSYVQHQFHKLIVGRCGLDEYTFTREYRGRYGYAAANHAPALKIAATLERNDPRAEPRIGERVPYVVVYSKPGDILINSIRHPQQLLVDSSLRLNAHYYINNVICAALSRAFALIGVDVRQWFATMPRTTRLPLPSAYQETGSVISHYFKSTNCTVCDEVSQTGLCTNCSKDPQKTLVVLNDRARVWERKHHHITKVCNGCTGTPETNLRCVSLDCPILFRLSRSTKDVFQADYLRNLIR